MTKFTDISEKGFKEYIVKYLVEKNQFRESYSKEFDKEICINIGQLFLFIEQTQLEKYEIIQR